MSETPFPEEPVAAPEETAPVAEEAPVEEAPPVRENPEPLPNTVPLVDNEGAVIPPGQGHPDDEIPAAGEPAVVVEETGRVIVPEDQRSDRPMAGAEYGTAHAGPDIVAAMTEPAVPDPEPEEAPEPTTPVEPVTPATSEEEAPA